ncbi:MFS general substrate transporter [Nadsonia fulvescens var. elongata DSM 6958]|uniref:MFS general substrate transporter n=1 Tax=Nadsonia fulvescens var. elongata DSM 6958 TaxID=857566 RepID=A0A1E3PDR4_9ASCO|nr:MFS general substrate transporter [Nadsonia fulvescens var. elongata DSM 6958]
MIICWAALLLGHVGAKNYGGILVLRFLLGMFEACISPSCMMICSMFYTKKEQPLRMCIFLSCNGVATMVGALLGYGLGHAKSHVLKEWQLIFLFIGLLNFVWGVIFLLITPDSPVNARFLTREERALVVKRVSVNMMGIKNPKFNKSQALEAALDIKVHALSLIGLGCGVINGGVSNFASSLIKGFGFSGLSATLLQLPTGAIEFVVLVAAGFLAIRFKNIRCYLLIGLTIPPLAGLVGIRQISLDHKWALVGCTWLQYIVGGPVILCWVLMTANIAGHTKRSIMNGWWFTLYAAGNIIGSNIFLAKEAPRYYSAMTGLIACYVGMFLLGGLLKYYMTWDNRKRDLENEDSEEAREKAILDGFSDLTDKQNRGFRYSL